MDIKEHILSQSLSVSYLKGKTHPSPQSFTCSLNCSALSCLEVQLVRCEDHAASCKAYYLYVKCESCLQAESVLNTLSHIEGAILGIAVNTFIALAVQNTSWGFISVLQLPSSVLDGFYLLSFLKGGSGE